MSLNNNFRQHGTSYGRRHLQPYPGGLSVWGLTTLRCLPFLPMNIKTATTHTVTFTVEAFWSEEGGMGQDHYGEAVQELPQAIRLFDLACVAQPKTNWVIVGTVKTATA